MSGKIAKNIEVTDGFSREFAIPDAVHLLGEEDFLSTMEKENTKWRDQCVKSGDFLSYDGTRIRYYYAIPENARANIVILHGFCEFWGKYHEMAWYFYQAGYSVYFMEQRGHGYSGRKVPQKDYVHVDDYDEYVEDVRQFMDQIVRKKGGRLPMYMFAHSMGGAIGALFLEKYPKYFRKAILSSPMLKVKTNGIPDWKIRALEVYAKAGKKEKELSVGQHGFSPEPDFAHSSTLSEPRYDYLFAQRLENEQYQTYGGTFGWVIASLHAGKKILRHANRVRIPVLLFQAGQDHLVDPAGQIAFAENSGSTRVVRYEKSKHEIFNATENIRRSYYGWIFYFLGTH